MGRSLVCLFLTWILISDFSKAHMHQRKPRAFVSFDDNPASSCNQVYTCRKQKLSPACLGSSTDEDCDKASLKAWQECMDEHSCAFLQRLFCENDKIVSIDFWKVACSDWGLEDAVQDRLDREEEERRLSLSAST